MKYFISAVFIGAVLALGLNTVSAATITCGVGEIVQPGPQLTPGTPAIPASVTPGYFTGPWWNLQWHPAVFHPAVPAVPATYGPDTCIPDPGYVPPVIVVPAAPAPAPIMGGTQPFCSSKTAPGYTVGLPFGGCANLSQMFGAIAPIYFAAGETITKNGKSYTCPWFFGSIECVI